MTIDSEEETTLERIAGVEDKSTHAGNLPAPLNTRQGRRQSSHVSLGDHLPPECCIG
jgi:hypothetical protein